MYEKTKYSLLEQILYGVNFNKYYSEVFRIPLSYHTTFFSSLS